MNKISALSAVLSVGFLLSACAGRAPAPIAVVQPIDDSITCEGIRSEVSANNTRIADLGTEHGLKVAQNVVMGVAGAFFILPLFLMDFQGAAGIDERALQSRNSYLASLAKTRCVATVPVA
jgi:hypothetical protein